MLLTDLLNGKIARAIKLLQEYEPRDGHKLAFSGGKDSQVLLELAKMAKVRFNAFFCRTSVDPPEVLQFIQDYYPEVSILSPPQSMFQLIEKNGCLPTRMIKYCCRQLKEYASPEGSVLVGVRAEESWKRAQRKQVDIVGKRVIIKPIFHFLLYDVWDFHEKYKLPSLQLYDEFSRIGCIGCPNASPKVLQKQFLRYPKYKKAYIATIKRLMDRGQFRIFLTAEQCFEWWISGLSTEEFFARRSIIQKGAARNYLAFTPPPELPLFGRISRDPG